MRGAAALAGQRPGHDAKAVAVAGSAWWRSCCCSGMRGACLCGFMEVSVAGDGFGFGGRGQKNLRHCHDLTRFIAHLRIAALCRVAHSARRFRKPRPEGRSPSRPRRRERALPAVPSCVITALARSAGFEWPRQGRAACVGEAGRGTATGPERRELEWRRRRPGLAWRVVPTRNSREAAREAERAPASEGRGWNRAGSWSAWLAGAATRPPFPCAAASPAAARSLTGAGHRVRGGLRGRLGVAARRAAPCVPGARPCVRGARGQAPRANGRRQDSSRRPWRSGPAGHPASAPSTRPSCPPNRPARHGVGAPCPARSRKAWPPFLPPPLAPRWRGATRNGSPVALERHRTRRTARRARGPGTARLRAAQYR